MPSNPPRDRTKHSARKTPPGAEPSAEKALTIAVTRGDETFSFRDRLPLLPLRDVVVFPHMTLPLLVGRRASIRAIERAVARDRMLFVTAQKSSDVADPSHDELYRIGTVVRVLQLFRLPDGTLRVLVEGLCRCRVERFQWSSDSYLVKVALLDEPRASGAEVEAQMRHVLALFSDYVHLNRRIPDEVLLTAGSVNDPGVLAHTAAAHLLVKVPQKQRLLESEDAPARLKMLAETLAAELEIVKLERKIEGHVRSQVNKNQKEFYLNEQLKAIRKELGHQGEFANEIEELAASIKRARMPREVMAKANKELDRLAKMSFMSPEATVVRSYLDWLAALPWRRVTRDRQDIHEVERILDEDHYGLRRVKERIVEYLSVLKLTGHPRGPILCFLGAPGVGKTSLGKSIARALGRRFVRVALGGVRDEAEIRGHRRTYIGAMPGTIIRAIRDAESSNPVMLIDEIDKMGADFRGDPASAMLEVLDPEQNKTFRDHYLDLPYDLSKVLFICTANQLETIPSPLLDRMDVISLSGYTDDEKFGIARKYLVPKQVEAHGLGPAQVSITDNALRLVAREYTREAGVRNLERRIADLCRKAAREVAEGRKTKIRIDEKRVRKWLGPRRFSGEVRKRTSDPGVATGLAVTAVGGDILFIEATAYPGKGHLTVTGQLGDVMQESATAAHSWVRSHAVQLGLDPTWFADHDVHLHIPAGAIPKDGPSAGITMATAIVSLVRGVPVSDEVAMTGEITLTGQVLPIGGVREKTLAAQRAGIKRVIIPHENEPDLEELPKETRQELGFVLADTLDDVLSAAFDGVAVVPRPAAVVADRQAASPV